MSTEKTIVSGEMENNVEDGVEPKEPSNDINHEYSENFANENGILGGEQCTKNSQDQLEQIIIELSFQNEYLKSQFENLKNIHSESGGDGHIKSNIEQDNGVVEDIKELHEKIELLSKELGEEKQTRGAAEKALEHLRSVYSEADAKAQELSIKLAEAQQKMDQEIKERDEKYSELDTKLNRLHKRAKQRIQDVQKEKDDIEAQFSELREKADQALTKQTALQQELERTRQQASEALKAIDADRQQLRSANNKLRDQIEELRHSLEPKENAIEALQQSLSEKEQMLEDMRGLLQTAEEKKQAAVAELSARHQKQIENFEAQLADVMADRSKAAETISSLQVIIVEKESKIAEVDAASSGEAARLKAAIESLKGELNHMKREHEKEIESWEVASEGLKSKLEIAESNCIHAEMDAAKMQSQLETELSLQIQLLSTRDAELKSAKEEIKHLENEFASYKIRAHSLLQRKEAELVAARDNELVKAQEEALKEAEKEMMLISAERDRALKDLQDALSNYDEELSMRDTALSSAEQQIKSMEMKLHSANDHYLSEKQNWEINLQNLETTWRLRCEALEAQKDDSSGPEIQKEIEDIKLQYKKLKEEHDSFRDLADKMIEEKDKEMTRLTDEIKKLQKSLELKALADSYDNYGTDFQKQDGPYSSTSAAEQQILVLARQQAQREEELAQSQRHILALQEEIDELERENRLHSQQETMLKEELRKMERMEKREGVDMTYLKNVILKLLETGEVEALLPVVGMLLQFSPDELQKCQQSYHNAIEVPPSPASESSGSSISLFSRFSFS